VDTGFLVTALRQNASSLDAEAARLRALAADVAGGRLPRNRLPEALAAMELIVGHADVIGGQLAPLRYQLGRLAAMVGQP